MKVAYYLDTYFNLDHRHFALGNRSPQHLNEALGQQVAAEGDCQYVVAHNLEYDLAIVGTELHKLAHPASSSMSSALK